MRGALGRGPERRRSVLMHDREAGPRIAVEVLDGIHLQVRVHHHHHRAELERPEQRAYELGAVGKRDQHALLGLDAPVRQHVTKPVRERLHVAVRQRARPGQERRPVPPPFPDARVQEILGDVELLGGRKPHGEMMWPATPGGQPALHTILSACRSSSSRP